MAPVINAEGVRVRVGGILADRLYANGYLLAGTPVTTSPTTPTDPTPVPQEPTATGVTGTPNSIRRLSVVWTAPTTGTVEVTRTAGGITHTSRVDAALGQATAGFELAEAYSATATQVSVSVAAVANEVAQAPQVVTVALPSVVAPPPVPAERTDVTRDQRFHPFHHESPWNLALPVTPTWEPLDSPATVSLRKEVSKPNGGVYANGPSSGHPITFGTADDPIVTATDTVDKNRSGSFPAPRGTLVANDTASVNQWYDRHGHVISADGARLYEGYAVQRYTETRWNVRRRHVVDLAGSGIGPQNGTRAYGGSAIGGLIRNHEVEQGRIDHPVAWAFRSDQLGWVWGREGNYGYYASGTFQETDTWRPKGWPVGTPRAGFSVAIGQVSYVWPATEQDYNAPSGAGSAGSGGYSGMLPMGSYFGIPADVDLNSLGLATEAGRILATAMQTWGGYVTDRAGEACPYIEQTAPYWFYSQLIAPNYRAEDVRRVLQACRVVAGNSAATPNGAPLGAARRAPSAVAIGPVGGADTTAPTTTLSSPNAGATTQRSTTAQGGYSDS